jgi:hypothetical protein
MSMKNSNDTIGNQTRDLPAVMSMEMNFWFPRFGVIPQLAVQILLSQVGLCIMGKAITVVSL